ncbi:MFS transporter [Bosea sp. NPDC055332]
MRKSGVPLWSAIVIGCLFSTMVVMDGAIVNVALPAMAADLGLSVIGQQLAGGAYLIALSGFTLHAARLGALCGRRQVLQRGLILFTVASVIGGLAGDGASLHAARAVQGLGASVLATLTLVVIDSASLSGSKSWQRVAPRLVGR